MLHDAHPGYITWEQFLRNQQRLDDNCTFRPEDRRGAVREGAALFQGMVLCGRCGRRMAVRYLATAHAPATSAPRSTPQQAGATCQFDPR